MKLADHLLEKVESNKKKIGEILLESTSLTEEQLKEALEIQKQEQALLGDILLRKNYIHPHDIIKAISHQINIPYLSEIKVEEIDPEIVKDLSINYAKHHEVLPIMETEYSVSVVMSDPFNYNVTNDLTEIFKKEVIVNVATPLKIQDAINRVYEKANRNLVDSIEGEFEENLDLDGPIDILDATADEAPVIRFVNSIIFRAVKERASDIHIEPYERSHLSFSYQPSHD